MASPSLDLVQALQRFRASAQTDEDRRRYEAERDAIIARASGRTPPGPPSMLESVGLEFQKRRQQLGESVLDRLGEVGDFLLEPLSAVPPALRAFVRPVIGANSRLMDLKNEADVAGRMPRGDEIFREGIRGALEGIPTAIGDLGETTTRLATAVPRLVRGATRSFAPPGLGEMAERKLDDLLGPGSVDAFFRGLDEADARAQEGTTAIAEAIGEATDGAFDPGRTSGRAIVEQAGGIPEGLFRDFVDELGEGTPEETLGAFIEDVGSPANVLPGEAVHGFKLLRRAGASLLDKGVLSVQELRLARAKGKLQGLESFQRSGRATLDEWYSDIRSLGSTAEEVAANPRVTDFVSAEDVPQLRRHLETIESMTATGKLDDTLDSTTLFGAQSFEARQAAAMSSLPDRKPGLDHYVTRELAEGKRAIGVYRSRKALFMSREEKAALEAAGLRTFEHKMATATSIYGKGQRVRVVYNPEALEATSKMLKDMPEIPLSLGRKDAEKVLRQILETGHRDDIQLLSMGTSNSALRGIVTHELRIPGRKNIIRHSIQGDELRVRMQLERELRELEAQGVEGATLVTHRPSSESLLSVDEQEAMFRRLTERGVDDAKARVAVWKASQGKTEEAKQIVAKELQETISPEDSLARTEIKREAEQLLTEAGLEPREARTLAGRALEGKVGPAAKRAQEARSAARDASVDESVVRAVSELDEALAAHRARLVALGVPEEQADQVIALVRKGDFENAARLAGTEELLEVSKLGPKGAIDAPRSTELGERAVAIAKDRGAGKALIRARKSLGKAVDSAAKVRQRALRQLERVLPTDKADRLVAEASNLSSKELEGILDELTLPGRAPAGPPTEALEAAAKAGATRRLRELIREVIQDRGEAPGIAAGMRRELRRALGPVRQSALRIENAQASLQRLEPLVAQNREFIEAVLRSEGIPGPDAATASDQLTAWMRRNQPKVDDAATAAGLGARAAPEAEIRRALDSVLKPGPPAPIPEVESGIRQVIDQARSVREGAQTELAARLEALGIDRDKGLRLLSIATDASGKAKSPAEALALATDTAKRLARKQKQPPLAPQLRDLSKRLKGLRRLSRDEAALQAAVDVTASGTPEQANALGQLLQGQEPVRGPALAGRIVPPPGSAPASNFGAKLLPETAGPPPLEGVADALFDSRVAPSRVHPDGVRRPLRAGEVTGLGDSALPHEHLEAQGLYSDPYPDGTSPRVDRLLGAGGERLPAATTRSTDIIAKTPLRHLYRPLTNLLPSLGIPGKRVRNETIFGLMRARHQRLLWRRRLDAAKALVPDSNDRLFAGRILDLDLNDPELPQEWVNAYFRGELENQVQVERYIQEMKEFTQEVARYVGLEPGKRLDFYLPHILDRQTIQDRLTAKIKDFRRRIKNGETIPPEELEGVSLAPVATKKALKQVERDLMDQINAFSRKHFLGASIFDRQDLMHLKETAEPWFLKARTPVDSIFLRHPDDIMDIYSTAATRYRFVKDVDPHWRNLIGDSLESSAIKGKNKREVRELLIQSRNNIMSPGGAATDGFAIQLMDDVFDELGTGVGGRMSRAAGEAFQVATNLAYMMRIGLSPDTILLNLGQPLHNTLLQLGSEYADRAMLDPALAATRRRLGSGIDPRLEMMHELGIDDSRVAGGMSMLSDTDRMSIRRGGAAGAASKAAEGLNNVFFMLSKGFRMTEQGGRAVAFFGGHAKVTDALETYKRLRASGLTDSQIYRHADFQKFLDGITAFKREDVVGQGRRLGGGRTPLSDLTGEITPAPGGVEAQLRALETGKQKLQDVRVSPEAARDRLMGRLSDEDLGFITTDPLREFREAAGNAALERELVKRKASQWVFDTMFQYDAANKPAFAQGPGIRAALARGWYQFSEFNVQQLNNILRTMTPRQRAAYMGVMFLIGGPRAIPFLNDLAESPWGEGYKLFLNEYIERVRVEYGGESIEVPTNLAAFAGRELGARLAVGFGSRFFSFLGRFPRADGQGFALMALQATGAALPALQAVADAATAGSGLSDIEASLDPGRSAVAQRREQILGEESDPRVRGLLTTLPLEGEGLGPTVARIIETAQGPINALLPETLEVGRMGNRLVVPGPQFFRTAPIPLGDAIAGLLREASAPRGTVPSQGGLRVGIRTAPDLPRGRFGRALENVSDTISRGLGVLGVSASRDRELAVQRDIKKARREEGRRLEGEKKAAGLRLLAGEDMRAIQEDYPDLTDEVIRNEAIAQRTPRILRLAQGLRGDVAKRMRSSMRLIEAADAEFERVASVEQDAVGRQAAVSAYSDYIKQTYSEAMDDLVASVPQLRAVAARKGTSLRGEWNSRLESMAAQMTLDAARTGSKDLMLEMGREIMSARGFVNPEWLDAQLDATGFLGRKRSALEKAILRPTVRRVKSKWLASKAVTEIHEIIAEDGPQAPRVLAAWVELQPPERRSDRRLMAVLALEAAGLSGANLLAGSVVSP